MMNKDYLRQVFAEEKGFLRLDEVAWIEVPRYDELSVVNLFPKFKEDENIMRYMPDRLPKGRLPDREYFFNVLNTVYPDYTRELIKKAGGHRNDASKKTTDFGVVKVSEEWWEKLIEVPFFSSKCFLSSNTIRT